MITIVTGWSPGGWNDYARNFMETFAKNWHDEVTVMAYVEEFVNFDLDGHRHFEQYLIQDIAPMTRFLEKYKLDEFAKGTRQKPGYAWKQKCINRKYNFRFDAVKFCRIPFYVRDAASRVSNGIMVWLDADMVVFKEVPDGFVKSLFPKKTTSCVYLGRRGYHTECGFTGFRLPQARGLINEWAEFYEKGYVFTLKEWHNSFVFDHIRVNHERKGLSCHNMTPGGTRHVWFQSEVGKYLDHLKGDRRKVAGFSKERMLKKQPRPPLAPIQQENGPPMLRKI
tara:strand:- start:792 stop:1634 length:843 start_codon:yes stop_codon:yes gene_type:complete